MYTNMCVYNNKTGSSLNKSIHQQGKQTGYLSIVKMLQLILCIHKNITYKLETCSKTCSV